MNPYPKPATPLPWKYPWAFYSAAEDVRFAMHAANAFPHLVAALELIQAAQWLRPAQRRLIANTLAIARGEVMP